MYKIFLSNEKGWNQYIIYKNVCKNNAIIIMINRDKFTLYPKLTIRLLYFVIYSVILEDKLSNMLFRSSITDSNPANPCVKWFSSFSSK